MALSCQEGRAQPTPLDFLTEVYTEAPYRYSASHGARRARLPTQQSAPPFLLDSENNGVARGCRQFIGSAAFHGISAGRILCAELVGPRGLSCRIGGGH